jgi:hypothetical protein
METIDRLAQVLLQGLFCLYTIDHGVASNSAFGLPLGSTEGLIAAAFLGSDVPCRRTGMIFADICGFHPNL